jgi:hypothetical protein
MSALALKPVPNEPRSLKTIRADEVEAKSIVWLDRPFLQDSAFHLVAGLKGVGKGTWLMKTIAKMTQGAYGAPREVLLISSEDSPEIDIIPRLLAAGAEMTRVHLVQEHIVLPVDLDRIRHRAREIGNVGLIIIDPIGNHLGGADTDKEAAVRFAISGLNNLADEFACVVIGVRHLGKTRTNGSLEAILGSTAWKDLPRAVLMFARDDEDAMVFHVQVVAGNRSGHGAAQAFRLELRDVGLAEPVTYASELGDSNKDVDDLLAAPRRSSKSQSARELILDILERDGQQESDALDARVAHETGLSARTVQNQRVALKNQGLIRNVPLKDEHGTVERWMVARTAAPRPDHDKAQP